MNKTKKNKIKKIVVMLTGFFGIINISLAQKNIDGFFSAMPDIIANISKIIVGIVLLIIFWGFVKFMSQDKKSEGKVMITWGVVALFILFSIWAILAFLQGSSFGKGTSTIIKAPTTI